MKPVLILLAAVMLLSSGGVCQMDSYYTSTPGGAPTPSTPTSPEALGLQIPSDISSSEQAPSSQTSRSLIMADEQSAYSATGEVMATSPTYSKMVVPPGGLAPNSLYISYAPRTVAACYLYANLPLWMKISGSGPIWFYEWYPSGMLDTQYAGYVYRPGWYKRWFLADVPGWHILQYYCGGWSNYAYIYVYGPGGYWVDQGPGPQPQPYPYPYGDGQWPDYPSFGYPAFSQKIKYSFSYGTSEG
ncbi:MAG: hypothetical protein QUS08_02100 [Methanothrix sp.]|nr:hypothetical protein [Methanothrix sp.]